MVGREEVASKTFVIMCLVTDHILTRLVLACRLLNAQKIKPQIRYLDSEPATNGVLGGAIDDDKGFMILRQVDSFYRRPLKLRKWALA